MYKKEVFPNAASISQVEFLADGTSIADIALLQERENWGLMSLFLGILSRLRHHALFVTNNGMIGISYGAQQGDIIAALAGCDVPVVLRKKGADFEFVGTCFVLSLMDGQAMNQRGPSGEVPKITTISIY